MRYAFQTPDGEDPEQHLLANIHEMQLDHVKIAFRGCANQLLAPLWQAWILDHSDQDAISVIQVAIRYSIGYDSDHLTSGKPLPAMMATGILSRRWESCERLEILFQTTKVWFERYSILSEQVFDLVVTIGNRCGRRSELMRVFTTVLRGILEQCLPEPRSPLAWKILFYQTDRSSIKNDIQAINHLIDGMPRSYHDDSTGNQIILSRDDLLRDPDVTLDPHRDLIASFSVVQVCGIYLYQISGDLLATPDQSETTNLYQIYLPDGMCVTVHLPEWIIEAINQFGSQGRKSARSIE